MRSVKERLFSIYYTKTSSVYAALSPLAIKAFHRAFTRHSLQGIEYSYPSRQLFIMSVNIPDSILNKKKLYYALYNSVI